MRIILLPILLFFPFIVLSSPLTEGQFEDQLKDIETARNTTGDPKHAADLAETLLKSIDKEEHPLRFAKIVYQQGRNAMEQNDYETALSHLNVALSIFEKYPTSKGLGNTYSRLGSTYRYLADYAKALEYLHMSLQVFEELGLKSHVAGSYGTIGVVTEKLGLYDKASEWHVKSLKLYSDIGDEGGIASALYNIGDIRRVMGDLNVALNYFEEALEKDKVLGELKYIAYSHNKIAIVNAQLGNFESARSHVQEAKKLFTQIKASRDLDWARYTEAQIEYHDANFTLAETINNGVMSRSEEHQRISLLTDSYRLAARIHIEKEEYEAAHALIEKALALANFTKEKLEVKQLLNIALSLHEKQENYVLAYEALKKLQEMDTFDKNQTRLNTVAYMQAETESLRKANQISNLKNAQELQRLALQKQQYIALFGTLFICCIFVSVFFMYRWRIQRNYMRHLRKTVKAKTAELAEKHTALENAYNEVEQLSLTDQLTGLNNRRYLQRYIDKDLLQCLRLYREGKHSTVGNADIVLYLIDVDNFKTLNDTYGHSAGDIVLAEIAQRLQTIFRKSDYLIRWGGEEFLGIARFVNRKDAHDIAERIQRVFTDELFSIDKDLQLPVSCSVGFIAFPLQQTSPQAAGINHLIKFADTFLYAAKDSGRNAFVGASDIGVKLSEDKDIQDEIKRAHDAAKIQLEYSSHLSGKGIF